MQKSVRMCFFAASLLVTGAAQAQWTGKAELGILLSNGNTETKSANAKLDLAHESDLWKNSVYAAALYGENGEFENAERYELRYQLDRKINDRLSWFVAARGEQDRFGGFAYQASLTTGVSYKVIDNPTTKFDVLAGAGYRVLRPQVLVKTDAGEVLQRTKLDEESDPVGTVGSNFEHAFTDTTKLTNKFLAEIGSSNNSVADDIALQVNMSDVLALAVGIGVRYNSDPPPLAESTDTQFTVNLVYNIK